VLSALGLAAPGDEFDTVSHLAAATNTNPPAPLASLKGKTPRFNNLCAADEMEKVVLDYLKIK